MVVKHAQAACVCVCVVVSVCRSISLAQTIDEHLPQALCDWLNRYGQSHSFTMLWKLGPKHASSQKQRIRGTLSLLMTWNSPIRHNGWAKESVYVRSNTKWKTDEVRRLEPMLQYSCDGMEWGVSSMCIKPERFYFGFGIFLNARCSLFEARTKYRSMGVCVCVCPCVFVWLYESSWQSHENGGGNDKLDSVLTFCAHNVRMYARARFHAQLYWISMKHASAYIGLGWTVESTQLSRIFSGAGKNEHSKNHRNQIEFNFQIICTSFGG